jgi:hypothetical protein
MVYRRRMRRSAGLGWRAWMVSMIRRLDHFTARHPILSMIVGYLLLVAFAMVVLPADPADLGRPTHRSAT